METDDLRSMVDLLKSLADESRLRILGLIAHEEWSVGDLADKLGLKEPTVSHHLARLQAAGLVAMRAEGTSHLYRLEAKSLHRLRRELLTVPRVALIADTVEGEDWERGVLRTYFDGERLSSIPTTRKKRNVVLNWLVTHFEQGARYKEAQVNEILKRHHEDVATLRREMIMTGLMERENGVYWRTEATRAS